MGFECIYRKSRHFACVNKLGGRHQKWKLGLGSTSVLDRRATTCGLIQAAKVVLVDLGAAAFLQIQLGEIWKIAGAEEYRTIFLLTLDLSIFSRNLAPFWGRHPRSRSGSRDWRFWGLALVIGSWDRKDL